MPTPTITEAGTYTLTVPAGSLTTDTGKEVEAATFSWTIKANEPETPTYEYNEGDRNHGERALTSFTITDGTNSLNVTDIHQTGKGAIFVDKTDNVFETTAGAAVSFSEFNYLGVWMHAYAYIDYNNDYTFGQDANATGTTGGELVTYNCYSTDGSNYYDIWGNTASPSNANSETYYDEDFNESKGLPHFFLPADLAVGDYRMRIKVDWNNLDPVQGSKDMVNGGCEVDFIVRVAEATGIENVEVENGAQVIYDLTGRKVENANVRGIYIINGKKVLVK
jgi:sialidase-1